MSTNEDSESKPTAFNPYTERLLSILNRESRLIKKATSERERLQYKTYQEERGHELGLTRVWAYHCSRCNHTWLPKDFDLDREEHHKKNGLWSISGQDLFLREPPKSCARCKSKSWKDPFMRRISKSAHVDDEGWIMRPSSIERFNALIRRGDYLDAVLIRPEWKKWLVRQKALRKFKHEGKDYVTDGVRMLALDVLEPKQK